jgi:hypothetical protein
MILILFFASIFGELRGPRPKVEETKPLYEDLDVVNLFLNISTIFVESDNNINIINEIIFSNCKNNVKEILSTILSPVFEIHESSELS